MNERWRGVAGGVAGLVGGYLLSRASFPLFRLLFERLIPLCPPGSYTTRCDITTALQLLSAEACAIVIWVLAGLVIFFSLSRRRTKA